MRRRRGFFNDKRMWVMLLLAVISAAVIAGIAFISRNSSKESIDEGRDILNLNEDVTGENQTSFKSEYIMNEQTTTPIEEPTESETSTSVDSEVPTEVETTAENAEAGISVVGEKFSKTNELLWPVVGNIILDFSMDTTIYFPTLDVYKCNPAVIIQSETGTKVVASAAGTVIEVGFNEEIGNFIKMDLGDDYSAVIGQLEDIRFKKGAVVASGEILGTVAEPTKYYSVEGCNVYFELQKDGKAIDPVDYFAY